ncbi:M48 family metalloprotease [Desulfovibrio sp. OttesenSCG-928-A18]|nr:M48 family metalloprotease [Desulfovibrio sp. OttesenSCG-928-A18]
MAAPVRILHERREGSPMGPPGRLICLLLCLVLFCSALLPPVTALALGDFSIQDERKLGEKFNVLIRSRLPLVQDSEIVDYCKGIVDRLAKTLPPQPFPFTVSVIRHNAMNAFACPGGYIFVHTGLIMGVNNESELAGVLAHEIAHVTQRHIARRIESSQTTTLLTILGALAGAFLGGQVGPAALAGSMAAGQAAMLSYSRTDEREADQVGIGYLTKAGYPPQGMVNAFEILSKRQWMVGGDIPSYLSTHPGLQERVRDMGVRVSLLPADVRQKKDQNAAFLRIQALVRARYGDPAVASQAFAKQLGQSGQRCVALLGQAILASRQNRINDATGFFDEAMRCAPKDQLVIREAGRFHYTKGNRHRGNSLLASAVSLNRNDTYALYYYARSLQDQGRINDALHFALLVNRRVPDDSEIHELLARLYAQGNRLFLANLHMAYSGLYANNEKRMEQFLEKAKSLARSPEDKGNLERFDRLYKERKEFW